MPTAITPSCRPGANTVMEAEPSPVPARQATTPGVTSPGSTQCHSLVRSVIVTAPLATSTNRRPRRS